MENALFSRLVTETALRSGWRKVFANSGGPGGDNVSVHRFGGRLDAEIARLAHDLASGHYRPGPLRRVSIPKRRGGFRTLSIPCVRDRVLQSAIHQLLEPVLEPTFSDDSFAYRPGRGVAQAIQRIEELRRAGFTHVVDGDIVNFFDSVSHAKLIEALSKVILEPELLRLISLWLDQSPDGRGLAQGSPLSPLLSNFYLDALDDALVGRGVRIVRFADDFVILCQSSGLAEDLLAKARGQLAQMGLDLHPEKTRLVDFDRGFKFLGRLFLKSFVIEPQDEEPPAENLDLPAPLEAPAGHLASIACDEADANASGAAPLPADDWTPERRSVQDLHDLSPILRPVYCLSAGLKLTLRGEAFAVEEGEATIALLPPARIGRFEVGPDVEVDIRALRHALAHDIVVAFVGRSGLEAGALMRRPSHGALHLDQARTRLDVVRHMAIARAFAEGRMRNQRALLARLNRRRKIDAVAEAGKKIGRIVLKLPLALTPDAVRGVEGEATAIYWPAVGQMLEHGFSFLTQVRQPPAGPADLLFSVAASVLSRDVAALIERHGLHPGIAFLHAERDRETPLAWDVIEPFRAPLVEGFVAYIINNRVIAGSHLAKNSTDDWVLTPDGRDRFFRAYEAWMSRPVQNHRDGGRSVWRGLIEADVLALKRCILSGESFSPYLMDY